MSTTGILFPHQLFEQNSLVSKCDTIYLVEEALFYKQYNFHKQKIAFHRAGMKFYESFLQSKNHMNAIKTGSYIPSFTLPDQKGDMTSLIVIKTYIEDIFKTSRLAVH